MGNSSVSVVKNYVKMRRQFDEAQRKYNEFVNEELPKLTQSVPTKSEYKKIVDLLMAGIGRGFLRTSVCEWIDKWGLEFATTTKYKGFVIKFYNNKYMAFKDGHRMRIADDMGEVKQAIDDFVEAEKKMPAIMAKLGLDKLRYEICDCKRSTIFERRECRFADDMIYSLHRFWKKNPNVKEWKVKVFHNMCSHTSEELSYECRSECEYSYAKGDYVSIEATGAGYIYWGASR